MRYRHAAWAVLLATAVLSAQEAGPRRLAVADLLDVESVSDPQPSPDGTVVVFTRSWVDRVADRRRSALWVAERGGSRPRYLTDGSSARWSPDGRRLAFLRDGEPRGAQIHVMWFDTREVTQITRVDEAPRELDWSPDGRRIAFAMQVPEREPFTIPMPKPPKGADWAPEPRVVTRLSYRRDRQGWRPAGFRHLFVVDASGGRPRQVTDGDFDHGAPRWLGASALVCSADRHPEADWRIRESDLFVVDVDAPRPTVEPLTDLPGSESDPVPSPNGAKVAFRRAAPSDATYVTARLAVLDRNTGGIRELTADQDRPIRDVVWAPDGESLLFTIDDHGARVLCRIDDDGGEIETLTRPRGQQFGDIAVTEIGGGMVPYGVHTAPLEPPALAWAPTRPGGVVTRLLEPNLDLLHGVELGAVEEFEVASPADGLPIQCWLVTPPDFDPERRYPLILQIHGGPHAMYGADFSFERQLHAAAGYCVLYTNPRGSTGYGSGFANGIQNAYPGRDFDDLMGAVDAVVERGFVDPDRLFVYGGSGGGVLTCWIVGMTDRFAAAVSMFPVTNWISFVGTTDGPYWYSNFRQLPWESIDEHWQRSPLRLVGNVTTPTMLITGELDLRTPMAQTEEYYQALKLRQVDTAMVRVPDEYHGAAGRRPTNQLRRILYVQEWFRRHDPAHAERSDPPVTERAMSGTDGGEATGWSGVLDEDEFAKLHELRDDAAPAARGEAVALGDANAYLSLPDGDGPHPGVIVIHEWWGLNEHVRHWADRLAADGYAALAVDLYDGEVATTRERASELAGSVDRDRARTILDRAHRMLGDDPRIRAPRRGVIGWCFGGGWSLQHAIATPDLDACVIYYGRLVTEPERLATIRAPILGIFGRQDRGIPPAAVAEFEAAIQAADLPAGHVLRTMTLDAPHAFANPSSARYVPEAAEAAWREVRAFLAARLKR